MRLVLDTNTVISGLLWQGPPARLIDAAQSNQACLYTSVPLLTELQGVLYRSKFAQRIANRKVALADLFEGYSALATVVEPTEMAGIVARDPSDDAVLACAVAAQADLIVSGDRDLLTLSEHQGIQIVNAANALQLLKDTIDKTAR